VVRTTSRAGVVVSIRAPSGEDATWDRPGKCLWKAVSIRAPSGEDATLVGDDGRAGDDVSIRAPSGEDATIGSCTRRVSSAGFNPRALG